MPPHRLSDPATGNAVEAIVGPAPAGELREHSALSDLEYGSLLSSPCKTGPRKLETVRTATRGKRERLSDKYIAGLLDSDGWIHPVQMGDRVQVRAGISQNVGPEFLELVAFSLTPPSLERYWGTIWSNNSGVHCWQATGSRAVSVLMRLRKYLVLKRAVADYAIGVNSKIMSVDECRQQFAALKGAAPMPKHPTRKWSAGYIDGNGHFHVGIHSSGRSASVSLRVNDEAEERVGIDLLQKAHGGSVNVRNTPNGVPLAFWDLSMDAAKLRSMFESGKGGLAKHMILKTDQVYFLLGCAQMGHFRDGEHIKAGVEQLRSQPHRLTGPGANVAKLLETVQDLPSWHSGRAQATVEATV